MNLKVFYINNHYFINNIVNYAKFGDPEKYLEYKEKEYSTKIYFSRKNDVKNIIDNIPTSQAILTDSLLHFKSNIIKL